VVAADVIHETPNAIHLDAITAQYPREDLHRCLELLRNHLIGSEPAELRDLRHVSSAHHDPHGGAQMARHRDATALLRRRRDRVHQHSRMFDPHLLEHLGPRAVTEEDRRSLEAGTTYELAVLLEHDVRDLRRLERERQVAAVEPVADDDDMVPQRADRRHLGRGDDDVRLMRGARRPLGRMFGAGDDERRGQHR
jgi:hypothetical protein